MGSSSLFRPMSHIHSYFFLAALILAAAVKPVYSQEGKVAPVDYTPSMIVLFNKDVPASQELADFYAKARGIPRDQLVGLSCPNKETITRAEFTTTIEGPLRSLFTLKKWWTLDRTAKGSIATSNKIKIIAIIYGVPLRVAPTPLPPVTDPETGKPKPQKAPAGQGDGASVDSELMRLGIGDAQNRSALGSPYHKKDIPFAKANIPQMLLTSRIDGPTPAEAKRLISDAMSIEMNGLWGKVYVDLAQKTQGGYKAGEEWIGKAGQEFLLAGFPAVVDVHAPTFPINYPMSDAAAYFGWYTGHANGPFKNPDFRFKKGAIVAHLHSYSATTLRSKDTYWVGPFLTKGAAATFGNVYEPYLTLTTHFDIFANRLLRGYTLAEAGGMATPGLSWMNIIVGDPLYRPFGNVDPNLNRSVDYDYKTFHMAMQRWGSADKKKDLFKNLEKAAKNQRSGNLYEALGQLSQEYNPKKLRAASKYYDEAFKFFREPKDKLRVRLSQIDMVRRTQGKEMAVKHLQELVADRRYAGIPELEAAKATLLQLNPPPPPAPDPKKKKK